MESDTVHTRGFESVTLWKMSNRMDSQVEWDTIPSFNSRGNMPLSFDVNLGTSPEVDEIDSNGMGR